MVLLVVLLYSYVLYSRMTGSTLVRVVSFRFPGALDELSPSRRIHYDANEMVNIY